jgi:hypothetical protein
MPAPALDWGRARKAYYRVTINGRKVTRPLIDPEYKTALDYSLPRIPSRMSRARGVERMVKSRRFSAASISVLYGLNTADAKYWDPRGISSTTDLLNDRRRFKTAPHLDENKVATLNAVRAALHHYRIRSPL